MKILDRAKAISELLTADKTATGGLKGLPLQSAAIAAAIGGSKSDAWRNFMTVFASNEAQLKRLTEIDVTAGDPWIRESSAYFIANSTCGGLTPEGLTRFINPLIDEGLDSTTDPNFVRFINFD